MRWSIVTYLMLAIAPAAAAQYPPQVAPKDRFPPQVAPKSASFPPQVVSIYADLIKMVDVLITKVEKHGADIAKFKEELGNKPVASAPASPSLREVGKQAYANGTNVVLYVGMPARIGDSLPTAYMDTCDWGIGVYLVAPDEDGYLYYVKTLEGGKAVSPPATPFEKSDKYGSGTADHDPWLSRVETKKIKALWPKGVPYPNNLKFYSLRPVYQNMYTMNNGRSKFTDVTYRDEPHPWQVSGGMHHIDKKHWRNVTGLALTGPIRYWMEDTDVRAFALVPKHRWSFPKGTLAYDVLLRRDGDKEHIFEVRVQEKFDNGWDDGTIYRPQTGDAKEVYKYRWEFTNEGLSAVSTVRTVDRISRAAKFVPTKTVVSDGGDFVPPGYVGAGLSCNACHSRVGQLYDVPGQIYREARRGDDGRFSWHPFDASGNVDSRWPLDKK